MGFLDTGARAAIGAGLLACSIGLAGSPVAASIVINEIMYNAPGAADPAFVELTNGGDAPIDVTGWSLLDDDDAHAPCTLAGTIPPGGFLVVAESTSTFQSAYPGAGPLNPTSYAAGQPDGGFLLGKDGDEVRLFDAGGGLVDRVAYDDGPPWPAEADGEGSSLELINPSLDNAVVWHWAASPAANPPGSPGEINAAFDDDLAPRLETPSRDPALPRAADDVRITVVVDDDLDTPLVQLFYDDGDGWTSRPMRDDGAHADGTADDGVFGSSVPPRSDGTVVRYFVQATDGALQTTRAPVDAPASWFAYTVGYRPPLLSINELVASNQSGIPDQLGDRDDWLELRNEDVVTVDLGGMYLSDDEADPQRWPLPSLQLPPRGFALIWCDDEPAQGPTHAPFTLPRSGGFVGVYDAIERGNTAVDVVEFPPQSADVSYGFLPDDADRRGYIFTPSPALANAGAIPLGDVVINELFSTSAIGAADFIELFNRGEATFDVGGWFLSDDPDTLARFAIPAGTLLAPGETIAFDDAQLGFGIAAGGETITLTARDEQTVVDAVVLGPLPPDVSLGRLPDGGTDWHHFSAWTRAAPNVCNAGAAAPSAVAQLRFDTPDVLRWADAGGAGTYDVVRGRLDSLRASGTVADAACHENNVAQPAAFAPDLVDPGDGLYYLVRAVNDACGFGTFSGGGGGEAVGRDDAIDPASGCP